MPMVSAKASMHVVQRAHNSTLGAHQEVVVPFNVLPRNSGPARKLRVQEGAIGSPISLTSVVWSLNPFHQP